ncbi:MAG: L-lactate dehydrogenase [Anaerolineales bacterium]|nr:L-lactate dehydrogenase [Anaerolineales bacterium]
MKIGIIGSGLVGATAAYALVMKGIGRNIVLVDLNRARAQAEADDIQHAVPFANPLNITAGDYADLAGAQVVIIAAGVSQRPGETRMELLSRNAAVFRQVVPAVLEVSPEAILLIATNPVDVMTHMAARFAAVLGVPSSRIIGSGTTLDTARFRTLLGIRFGVDPQHIHGYVIGEHGDSEVLTWSQVTIGGLPLDIFCESHNICFDEGDRLEIEARVRRAAYEIIEHKGATYYGIGSALSRIIQVILLNQRSILTVCTLKKEVLGVSNVTLSLPHLLGGDGILDTFSSSLNQQESEALKASAEHIRSAIDELEAANAI